MNKEAQLVCVHSSFSKRFDRGGVEGISLMSRTDVRQNSVFKYSKVTVNIKASMFDRPQSSSIQKLLPT